MILSHYTTWAGLEGMLRSPALWATNFLQLDDTSEYFYAWSVVNREAMRLVMDHLPDDRKKANFDLEETVKIATEKLREFGKKSDPYGQLFVFSFARGQDDDEDRRGILTLWKLYAKIDGYCIQYNDSDIRRVLDVESAFWHYESVNLVPVRYGVDIADVEFKKLSWQLSQYYLRDIIQLTGDHRIELNVDHWMAESAYFRLLLEFCASHKDPLYKDERELRIFACPSARAQSRVFTGIAHVKPIFRSPTGKQYIALGADVRPGFTPFRIMGANKASSDFSELLDDYEFIPEYCQIDLPVST
jgi:hypothetical protein